MPRKNVFARRKVEDIRHPAATRLPLAAALFLACLLPVTNNLCLSLGGAMAARTAALQSVADVLRSRCQSVAFLTGAGVSVAAGIPDFRSPGGMYDTLRPELLTATAAQRRAMALDPTTVVSWVRSRWREKRELARG